MLVNKKLRSSKYEKPPSFYADVFYRLKKNKTAMVALAVIVIITLLAIFAGVIADYDTQVIQSNPTERLQKPSAGHIFGTDPMGRDLFARVIYGARYSLTFGLICTFTGLIFGCLFGAAAAYFGGAVDTILMFIFDCITCIPGLLLSLTLVTVLGPGMVNLVLAITISAIPGYARSIRAIVMGIVRQEYIEAARAIGVSHWRVIAKHVLPNAIALIIVNATMHIAGFIMSAAGLSFIGMGIQPPSPEWGAMLNESREAMRMFPHTVLVPGLAIVVTALSFNLLGDGLSEALDPRMKE